MVMEEAPSPQSVGREFVRQYYTLLNKAPIHLHRFYNNASSFVHGGLDAPDRETPPVIGQKEIHNRIQQLNFRDCHAKISQVDSQATLGNGVVVQVTGELSNGGQPMRRFTQTFVLAAQSPKQYYVHNDIFRYQDFVFSEEDGEWDYGRGGVTSPPPVPPAPPVAVVASPGVTPLQVQVAPVPPQPQPPVPPPPTATLPQPPPASLPAPYFPASPPPPCPPPVISSPPANMMHATLNGHQEEQQGVSMGGSDTSCGDIQASQELEEEPEEAPPSPPPSAPQPAPPVNNEPKTYANLLKSGGPPVSYAQQQQQQQTVAPPSQARPSQPTQHSSPPHQAPPQNQRPRPQRAPRTDSTSEQSGVPASSGNTPPSSTTGGSSRRYSDSQQLFLGNLPHSATKEEVRALFEKFGPIAELRVHSKPAGGSGTGPGGRVVPNYAFLTFEDVQSAQNCLNAGPLYYPSEDAPDAQVLNVQRKKSTPGGGSGGPGRSSSGGGGGGGGPRGGGGGPRPPRPSFQRGPYQRR